MRLKHKRIFNVFTNLFQMLTTVYLTHVFTKVPVLIHWVDTNVSVQWVGLVLDVM